MPLEQSRIAIAPGVVTHPNLKNVPTGPMTSKQLKKSYKERNAGPKMTKAERRAEERALIEQNRLELEREKKLEREKRKRDKKKAEEEAAKAERRKAGIPEKSRFVRPSQNRITGFLALGKRPRVDSDIEEADTTRDNSSMGDMRPPKSKRLSTDRVDEDSRCASPEHDMGTPMLDITMGVNEGDISTVDLQDDIWERTRPKAATQGKAPSQRKERPRISDDEDELEPVIEQFRSSQLAEAPNFGTIRTQTDDSSSGFVSVRLFTKPSQLPSLPKPSLPNQFAASQDYFAQFSDDDDVASPTNSNTFMPKETLMVDADAFSILRSLSVSESQAQTTPVSARRAFGSSSAHYDLFGTDSHPKSTRRENESIDKTYSPIRASPAGITTAAKPPVLGQFEASQDYDAMFNTQPPPPQRSSPHLKRKTPKKSSQKKPRPKISDDEEEVGGDAVRVASAPRPPALGQSKAVQHAAGTTAAPKPPAVGQPNAASITTEPKRPVVSRRDVAELTTEARLPVVGQRDAAGLTTAPNLPDIAQFEASQDYDSYFATQAAPSRPSSPRSKNQTPKELLPKSHHRPQSSDDEEYDNDFATYETVVQKAHVKERKESANGLQVPHRVVLGPKQPMRHDLSEAPKTNSKRPKARHEPPVGRLMNIEPPSQDYDALLGGTQPLAPSKSALAAKTGNDKKKDKSNSHTKDDEFSKAILEHRAAKEKEEQEERREEVNKQKQKMKDAIAKRIEQSKSNGLSVPQPAAKPLVAKTRITDQVNPAARFDGFFSPGAPHAKAFQKGQTAKTPTLLITKAAAKSQHARLKKVLNQDQLAASQDYLSMLGDDDSDLDGDITPDLPAPKITMSPENMAKHQAYNARQNARASTTTGHQTRTPVVPQPPQPMKTPAQLRQQAVSKFKMPATPNNAGQARQPLRPAQSAVQNTSRATTQAAFKPQVPAKQTYTPVQRTMQSFARPPIQRHSAPPQPTQVLKVGDDFEVLSGTQLLREMTEDGSLSRSTAPVASAALKERKKSSTGTMNNLSQHLPWLLAGGDGGPHRQPLKPVQQSMARPPSIQNTAQMRTSYPPNHPANTSTIIFPPTKVENTPQSAASAASAAKAVPAGVQTAPPFVQPKPKPMPKPAAAPKTLPSIEVDDMTDLDFPSNSQVLREIEEDHRERTRSRSLSVAAHMARPLPIPVNRPVVQQQPNPQTKSVAREPTPVYKLFESNSQLMREMAEEEAEEKTNRAPETPCPAKQKQVPIQEPQTSKGPNQIKPSVEAISFNIASDELESMSQIARELAEEETTSNKTKQTPKVAPTTIIPPPRPAPDQQKPFPSVRTNTNTPPSAKSYKRLTH